ncbi:isoaspartyl peptidase/L-asparaginase 3 [Pyrus ussuriensis x Pyrus communis]|uniref:Isoaspartyl peptidase/L-asparaginase 3 n=1 Tax=Pyrus ussuriensis x Pyrus communis TaxID=2448454 RepID=A0A5N5FFH9_9ROSA|nr:isoaspartyl peptidase/L-asparaginase 3 [Pyrus ussuriensis x Pyrus communis]
MFSGHRLQSFEFRAVPFLEAVRASWRAVDNGFSVMDSVVEDCPTCEEIRCDGTDVIGTIGLSGSSDENGETTFDALVMDGVSSIHVTHVINKKQVSIILFLLLL